MADVQKRLFESVNGDDVNAVKTALDQGGVINEKDEEEDTPLLIASAYNYSQTPAIVKLLLDRGANIRARAFNGKTALGRAVSGDEINYQLVELLLSRGVDVNAQDSRGRTALMEVANKQTDQSRVIDLLLKTGAKTDIQDKRGDTALILSAGYPRNGGVSLLLKYGANTEIKNNNGQTALDKANEYKLTGVADLLGKYGLSQLKARKVVETGLDGAYAPHITKNVQQYLGAGKGSPKRYFSGLSARKRTQRKKEISKFGSMSWKSAKAYVGFKTDRGVKTRRSNYSAKWNKKFPDAKSLPEKARASGVPLKYIKESYNRGMAAWRTGHRPGASQQQWGYARTSSFLLKGKTYHTSDSDLVEKAKNESKSARKWWKSQGC